MDIKVSKHKHICRWVDWENLIYISWKSQKPYRKTKKGIYRGKRSKILSELKPVENIGKNLQSFLEIIPAQKEVLPSHKLRDHTYEY